MSPYHILTIVMMFYPLSKFLADVSCGLLKTVVISLISLLICWVLFLLWLSVLVTIKQPWIIFAIGHNQGILAIVLIFLSLLFFIVGLTGYQANFIQFGLDQLFEAPSKYLGLFVHYNICYVDFPLRIIVFFHKLAFFIILCVNKQIKIAKVAIHIFYFDNSIPDQLLEASMVP